MIETDYDKLKSAYKHSKQICNPIDFQIRQKNLLETIANYLLEKDDPIKKASVTYD